MSATKSKQRTPRVRVRPSSSEHLQLGQQVLLSTTEQALLAEHVGRFHQGPPKLVALLRRMGCYELSTEVEEKIRDTKIRGVSLIQQARCEAFVQNSVTVTLPQSVKTAQRMKRAAVLFVVWAVAAGHPLEARAIWKPRLVEVFIQQGLENCSPPTRSNYRGDLKKICRIINPAEFPDPQTPLPQNGPLPPYTAVEMEEFRGWATGQANEKYRHRAMLMLALCGGAGLSSTEVALLYPEHFTFTENGVLIDVQGKNPRVVVLRRQWELWMRRCWEFAHEQEPGERIWLTSASKSLHRLISASVEKMQGSGPNSIRLRNTWLVELMNAGVPNQEMKRAAGVRNSKTLDLLTIYTRPLTDDDYIRVLRGDAS